jgi:nucleoside phosphorylase
VPIVAVTGLAAEAAIARRAGLRAICAGGVPARTAAAVAAALEAGDCTMLVSFGIAGGLRAGLAPGTLVVAGAVMDSEGEIAAPPFEFPQALRGTIFGSTAIVAAAAEKAALHARTGALAVDLESHLVARAASAIGLPWAAVRTIADTAEYDLPPAAQLALRENGRPDLLAVLGSLCAAPVQLPALLRTARQTRAALRALVGAGRVLRRLGGVDAGDRLLDVT